MTSSSSIEDNLSTSLSGKWNTFYNNFINDTKNGSLNHNPFVAVAPTVETQSISMSAIVKSNGYVNTELGILYAYTSRDNITDNLLGYGAVNKFVDKNLPIMITVNYQFGDEIKFLYVYPEYPIDNQGLTVPNLGNANIGYELIQVSMSTLKVLPNSGTSPSLNSGTSLKPTGNAVINTPWDPVLLLPTSGKELVTTSDPIIILDNLDNLVDDNLNKLNALLYNINITKSALMDNTKTI